MVCWERGRITSKDRVGPADIEQSNSEKAFDEVPDQRLSNKLTCHRMGGKTLID